MEVPKVILPILEKISSARSCAPEFWRELDGDSLIDAFFDLSGELMMSDIEEERNPVGYVQLAYIFYWETNCQFSGWYAIENKKDELDKILQCYMQVGLVGEAHALEAAVKMWFATEQDHDAVGAAYRKVENPYREEEKRFLYLANYFKDNAESLLYES